DLAQPESRQIERREKSRMSQAATSKTRGTSRLSKAALVASSVVALTVSLAGSAAAVLNPLPWNADTFQQK
ncbi:MAG TPA: hypothetical protein VLG91_05200, partial [Streptomyces sp.]|nr:hypothetical protein [Streptomyces sp.]